jgi:hypothetical protein
MALALIVGSAGLYLTLSSNPPATPHLAQSLSQLPSNSRTAAADTVDLSIATPRHVEVVAAMVLPHNLAVTTTQIPADAHITGSTPGDADFPVAWVGRDQVIFHCAPRSTYPTSQLRAVAREQMGRRSLANSEEFDPVAAVRVGEHDPR